MVQIFLHSWYTALRSFKLLSLWQFAKFLEVPCSDGIGSFVILYFYYQEGTKILRSLGSNLKDLIACLFKVASPFPSPAGHVEGTFFIATKAEVYWGYNQSI